MGVTGQDHGCYHLTPPSIMPFFKLSFAHPQGRECSIVQLTKMYSEPKIPAVRAQQPCRSKPRQIDNK